MFQFPGFASCTYVFSTRYLPYDRWVSPFGHFRIKACLSAPRNISQITTSFIASYRQGIHRVRLFTWPYNPKTSDCFLNSTVLMYARISPLLITSYKSLWLPCQWRNGHQLYYHLLLRLKHRIWAIKMRIHVSLIHMQHTQFWFWEL